MLLRLLSSSIIWAALMLSPITGASLNAGASSSVRPNIVAMRLETNKDVYHLGGHILLRVSLINKSRNALTCFFRSALLDQQAHRIGRTRQVPEQSTRCSWPDIWYRRWYGQQYRRFGAGQTRRVSME
jgi:hypothetical protein